MDGAKGRKGVMKSEKWADVIYGRSLKSFHFQLYVFYFPFHSKGRKSQGIILEHGVLSKSNEIRYFSVQCALCTNCNMHLQAAAG